MRALARLSPHICFVVTSASLLVRSLAEPKQPIGVISFTDKPDLIQRVELLKNNKIKPGPKTADVAEHIDRFPDHQLSA